MHSGIAASQSTDEQRAASRDELAAFRGLMGSLTADAIAALEALQMWCEDAEQLERCCLIGHYLDYMKRLCDGKV